MGQSGVGLDGWAAIDEILEWIDSGPLALPAEFGRSHLPIDFVRESRNELRAAAAHSPEALAELIEYRHYTDDMASNMDW